MVLVTVILAVTQSGRSGAVKDRNGDGDSQNVRWWSLVPQKVPSEGS